MLKLRGDEASRLIRQVADTVLDELAKEQSVLITRDSGKDPGKTSEK